MNMKINDAIIDNVHDYINFFSTMEIQFPVQQNISEEELFVLLSLFSRSEVIGISIDDRLTREAQKIFPTIRDDLLRKGLIYNSDEHLVLPPELALIISCLSNADKTIVFNNDSLDASKCNLSVYIQKKMMLTVYKIGESFDIRLDSDINKFSNYLFSNYFQIDPYHNERFLTGIAKAFSNLPEETYALNSDCSIERFFCFKIFDRSNPQSSATIYNLVQIEEFGAGFYELEDIFLKRTNKLYYDCFRTERKDVVGLFANFIEVICNGK